MGRGSTGLESSEYDAHLASRGKVSRGAREELEARRVARRTAHDGDGVGWHFGIGDTPVKATSKEHFRQELKQRGLAIASETTWSKKAR
jgi:hypothetical protein